MSNLKANIPNRYNMAAKKDHPFIKGGLVYELFQTIGSCDPNDQGGKVMNFIIGCSIVLMANMQSFWLQVYTLNVTNSGNRL